MRADFVFCAYCQGDGNVPRFTFSGETHERCDACDGTGEVTEEVAAEQEREQAEMDARCRRAGAAAYARRLKLDLDAEERAAARADYERDAKIDRALEERVA